MSPRTLVVMRHAQAESSAATDAERPLSELGRRDAVAAGGWLSGLGLRPDRAVVSAATRTRQTWSGVCRGAGWTVDPCVSGSLYEAGVDSALDLVRLLEDSVGTAVVLGHNPTMAALAQLLDDGEGDLEATNQMLLGRFPPGAVAVLEVGCAWDEVAPDAARLTSYRLGSD